MNVFWTVFSSSNSSVFDNDSNLIDYSESESSISKRAFTKLIWNSYVINDFRLQFLGSWLRPELTNADRKIRENDNVTHAKLAEFLNYEMQKNISFSTFNTDSIHRITALNLIFKYKFRQITQIISTNAPSYPNISETSSKSLFKSTLPFNTKHTTNASGSGAGIKKSTKLTKFKMWTSIIKSFSPSSKEEELETRLKKIMIKIFD